MTIGKQITLGFTAVLAILLCICAVSKFRVTNIVKNGHFLANDALPGLQAVGDILSYAQQNYINTLKGVISTDAKEKESFAATIQANVAKINDLTNKYAATITLAKDTEIFGQLLKARGVYVTTFREVVELDKAGKSKEAAQIIQSRLQPAYDAFEQAIAVVVDFNKENATRAGNDVAEVATRLNRETLVGTGLALLLGIGVATFVTRKINRALRRTAESLDGNATQTASASGQLSETSQALASGASQQAASLEETSAALEEINSMVGRNAESATRAKALTTETRQAADASAAGLKNLDEAMQAIQSSSNSIAKIIKSIDEIAFQTNILALNAAVEAARAGEAGAGFSVVADEVRNLAQRAALAARETAEKIEDALGKTTQGVQASNQLGENLKQIIDKARSVDDLVGEIAQASKEQADGIGQVNAAVTQMDRVTQTNAASAEESASASEELNVQASSMQESVAELLALIGRKTQRDTSEIAPATPDQKELSTPSANGAAVPPARTTAPKSNAAPENASGEASSRNGNPMASEENFKSF